ncbi:MAG: conserved hypothetical protein [Methanobrevibacter sp. CfCl-M3]
MSIFKIFEKRTLFAIFLKEIERKAEELQKLKIKEKDAIHLSCAINYNCSYFITTDYKLIWKDIKEIEVISPMDFIKLKD